MKGHERSAVDFRLALGGQYEPQKISEQRKDRTEVMLEEWSSDPTVLDSGGRGWGRDARSLAEGKEVLN